MKTEATKGRTHIWRAAAILVGIVALLVAGSAPAQDKSFEEEVLEILREKGDIDQEEYDRLKQKAAEEKKAREPSDWTFKWKNGFQLQKGDGKEFQLKFGGRIQNDWGIYDPDSDVKRSFGGNGTGTKFRRARLFFEGTMYEHLFFKAQYDFADNSTESGGSGNFSSGGFKDVYVGLRIPKVGELRVGHMKEPFSLEEQTSSKYTTFMERALPNLFSPSRNTGIALRSDAADLRIHWSVGFFRDTDGFGEGFSSSSDYRGTARFTASPVYLDDGDRVFHIGTSYSHQWEDSKRYRARPENNFAPRIVDTSRFSADHVNLLGIELAGLFGSLHFQSEAIWNWTKPDGQNLPGWQEYWGAYGEVGYFLTGEVRPYSRRFGEFGRVSPKQNFNPKEGGWGAWQVALRYSHVDLNGDEIKGGKLSDVTAGINWHLFPNFRVMVNYVWGREREQPGAESGDVHSYIARFSLDF